jgi:hypothetical protein
MHKLRYIKLLFIAVIMLSIIGVSAAVNGNFRTHLSGDEEVPVRVTNAQGQALFKLSDDGTELSYKLIVANIDNVVASHIHVGAAGVNGPVVAFLFGSVLPGGGRTEELTTVVPAAPHDLVYSFALAQVQQA